MPQWDSSVMRLKSKKTKKGNSDSLLTEH
jgi:hypothetical protein